MIQIALDESLVQSLSNKYIIAYVIVFHSSQELSRQNQWILTTKIIGSNLGVVKRVFGEDKVVIFGALLGFSLLSYLFSLILFIYSNIVMVIN